jgi:hypothetical protein
LKDILVEQYPPPWLPRESMRNAVLHTAKRGKCLNLRYAYRTSPTPKGLHPIAQGSSENIRSFPGCLIDNPQPQCGLHKGKRGYLAPSRSTQLSRFGGAQGPELVERNTKSGKKFPNPHAGPISLFVGRPARASFPSAPTYPSEFSLQPLAFSLSPPPLSMLPPTHGQTGPNTEAKEHS